MVWSRSLLIICVLLPATSGCLGTRDIFHPGDEKTQVVRSQIYDPYPENDLGPAIAGGRPPDYDSPRAEVLRVQPRLGDPLLVPAQVAPPNTGCPPGYAPNYAPTYAPGAAQGVYSQSANAIAPPVYNSAYNNVPGLVAAPPDQLGGNPQGVIYVPPPAVEGGAAAGP